MKILCAEYTPDGAMAVGVIGDNALLRNNDDFYFPGFTQELSGVPQLVVRLNRMGKSIPERFAGRYYAEVGVGMRFYADTLEEELKEKGLPYGLAFSFDGSAAISELRPVEDVAMIFSMKVNGGVVFEGNRGWPIGVDQLVSEVSDYYMIKIGDFLYCGNPFRYKGLKVDDRIQMALNGEEMLDFRVR